MVGIFRQILRARSRRSTICKHRLNSIRMTSRVSKTLMWMRYCAIFHFYVFDIKFQATNSRNEKSKVEAKLRDVNTKIRSLETEKTVLKKESDEHIENLTQKLTNLRNELKKSTLEKENLQKKIDRMAGEKNSALENDIESRDKIIAEKETELSDLKEATEIKERKLKCDIGKEAEEKVRVTNKLNSDIESMKTEISKKENQITKLEKEKRDISITQDKGKKKINDIESEVTKLRDALIKLEAEKKTNNFGKYEREKMTLEINNLTKEKHTIAGRLEDLTKEKFALNKQITDLLKLDVVKTELSTENEELNATVTDLRTKCKDLEGNVRKEKEGGKNKEKALNEQIKTIKTERDKLQGTIDDLEETVKVHDRNITKLGSEVKEAKKDLIEKEKQCNSMQKDGKSKALTDRISLLEKQKHELETKTRSLESDKSSLSSKVSQLEKDKELTAKKMKDLEESTKQVNGSGSSSASSSPDLSKLQKENQTLKKEKDDLGKTMKAIEKDLKKHVKDVKPNKVQDQLKKLAEKIESNSLLSGHETSYTNGVGAGASDSSSIKSNFDALQKDYESRTGEIEKLTSQLNRAKADSNTAVEKLRKSESDLSQIKEKNAQLSDELLNKSRVIAGMENGGGGDTRELQRQVDDLKKKVAEGQGGAKVKKSVKFSAEPEILKASSGKTVNELEEALEAAYRERNEIINTCRKEVEFHRTIASELEQSIMEVCHFNGFKIDFYSGL